MTGSRPSIGGIAAPVLLLLALCAAAAGAIELPTLAGFADEGTYRFYLNEEVLVTTHFTWSADGTYDGGYTLSMAGQTVNTSMKITPDPSGRWMAIDMDTPQGRVTVAREDTIARMRLKDEDNTARLKPGTFLFENFHPALMAAIVHGYDAVAGGKQTLPVYVIPAVVIDATLEHLDRVERTVGNADLLLDRYLFGLHGVDITLYVDQTGKIIFGDVPSQHGAYVREGYESLMKPEAVDPLLSKPEHEVAIDSNVEVPMRDGLRLKADLYRPKEPGVYPAILVRTPYKKEMNELQGRFFARRGYVYVVQDCRGRFSSPGKWEPFVNEAKDGYDTVEWAAAQPWSSGKVGMIGASYLGWVQWWAARDRPPHLTTIIPNVAPPDPYFNIPYEYGCFFLTGAIWWADVLESEATGDLSGKRMREVSDKKYETLLRGLPVVDLDRKVLGKKNKYWRTWIDHPDNDAYWEPANFLDKLESLNIPVFHQSGWFDGDGIGSKLNYLKMASYGHANQKLVLGPWGHTDTAMRRMGDRDFGEKAIIDLQRDYLRWLDRWLKGVDNGIDREPLVSIFVMGTNEWLRGATYPLKGTQPTNLYLAGGGHANGSGGDGRATFDPPAENAPPDRYTYDPGDPTPSPRFYLQDDEEDGKRETSVEAMKKKAEGYYALIDSTRTDILVYDTEPLASSVTFAGPIEGKLYASSSGKDTDWFMRLSEVGSDGKIFPLVEGKIRARYNASFSEPELLEPGKVYEYSIDLWQTGITIPAGNRIRVEVASASFPLFSRNLNTGGHNEKETKFVKAEQTVYHDARYPSHVILPVIPIQPGE